MDVVASSNLTDVAFEWPQYRIFLHQPDDWSEAHDRYVELLKTVIAPLLDEFGDGAPHMHFFRYIDKYRAYAEPVEQRITSDDDEDVFFVKLRFATRRERRANYDAKVAALTNACAGVRGVERPTKDYDIYGDLTVRFPESRVPLAAGLIHHASLLALRFAGDGEPYDPDEVGRQGGSFGAVHLVANTLGYFILGDCEKDVSDWNRWRKSPRQQPMP